MPKGWPLIERKRFRPRNVLNSSNWPLAVLRPARSLPITRSCGASLPVEAKEPVARGNNLAVHNQGAVGGRVADRQHVP